MYNSLAALLAVLALLECYILWLAIVRVPVLGIIASCFWLAGLLMALGHSLRNSNLDFLYWWFFYPIVYLASLAILMLGVGPLWMLHWTVFSVAFCGAFMVSLWAPEKLLAGWRPMLMGYPEGVFYRLTAFVPFYLSGAVFLAFSGGYVFLLIPPLLYLAAFRWFHRKYLAGT